MKLIAMLTICVVDFLASACFAVIATFFPAEAENKGLDNFLIGLIFGIFQGIQFFFSPIFGLYMNRIGIKRLYLNGIGVTTISCFLFGFTSLCPPNSSTFMIFTFTLRLLQGIGCAAFLTSSYVMIVRLYPNTIGTAFGAIQVCGGLGFSLGPALGGFLYEAGGYITPFITIALCLFLLLIVSVFTIPPFKEDVDEILNVIDTNENQKLVKDHRSKIIPGFISGKEVVDESSNTEANSKVAACLAPAPRGPNGGSSIHEAFAFFSLIKIHPSSLILDYLVVIAGTLSVGFVDPAMEPHTRELNLGLSSPLVGSLFLALSGPYTIFSMALGRALDFPTLGNYQFRRFYVITACLLSALSLSLSGPSPIVLAYLSSPVFSRQSLITFLVVSQAILGVAFAAQIVVPFTDMMRRIQVSPISTSDLKLHGLVSGLFGSALALGAFLGPFLGGLLTQHLTYGWSSTIISGFNLVIACVCLSITAYEMGAGIFVSQ